MTSIPNQAGTYILDGKTPVAYVTGYSKGYAVVQPVDRSLLMPVGMALYRSPPKRKPLMDEDIDALRQGEQRLNFVTLREFRVIARAIERAHGIGGEE